MESNINIKDNFKRVMDRIKEAAIRSNRKPDDVKLVAVSKTVDIKRILEAVDAGATILGENYVQEALQKIPAVPSDVNWHMIGHLQKNKVKYVIEPFSLIHSVDSEKIANEIQKRGAQKGKKVDILIEVNLSGEESKFGTPPENLPLLVESIAKMDHLNLLGLMTMPPFFSDPEKSRPFFAKLRELLDKLNEQRIYPFPLKELSMGMSNDFFEAILEGATMVRVGTAIFGERKNK